METAFNLYDTTYDIGETLKHRQVDQRINADYPSSTTLNRAVLGAVEEADLPSTVEIAGRLDSSLYLWIGMSPPNAKNFNTKKKGADISLTYSALALRVVVPITPQPAIMLKIYALVFKKDNGLWKTVTIPANEVFFFKEFTTPTSTTINKKELEWFTIIKNKAAAPDLVSGAAPTAGDVVSRSSNQVPRTKKQAGQLSSHIPVPAKISFANEIELILAVFAVTGDFELLERLHKSILYYSPDLQYAPPLPANVALHRFLNLGEAFDFEDSVKMLEEVRHLWPELSELEIDTIQILRALMVEEAVSIPFKTLRGLLALLLRDPALIGAKGVMYAKKLVESILGPGSRSSITSDLTNDQMRAVISSSLNGLRELVEFNERQIDLVTKEVGPLAISGSIEEIWTQFAKRPDQDSAKLFVDQAVSYMHLMSTVRSTEVGKKLKTFVEILEKLKLG